MSNIILLGSTLRDVIFKDSKVVGVNFSSCNRLSQLAFSDCLLDLSVFQGLEIPNFKAQNSSLKEVDLSEGKFPGASFCGSNLKNALFNASDLSGSDFRNAINYFLDPRFTRIKKSKFSMPEAMSLLNALEIIVE